MVRRPVLRPFFQSDTTGYWAIKVGAYIWGLENQDGVVNYHIGTWTNAGDVDGRWLMATEREEIGDTGMTDYGVE